MPELFTDLPGVHPDEHSAHRSCLLHIPTFSDSSVGTLQMVTVAASWLVIDRGSDVVGGTIRSTRLSCLQPVQICFVSLILRILVYHQPPPLQTLFPYSKASRSATATILS